MADENLNRDFAIERWRKYTTELDTVLSIDKSANVKFAADWAKIGQEAFAKGNYANAGRSFVNATQLLHRACDGCKRSARIFGWLCVALQIVYLFAMITFPYFVGRNLSAREVGTICSHARDNQDLESETLVFVQRQSILPELTEARPAVEGQEPFSTTLTLTSVYPTYSYLFVELCDTAAISDAPPDATPSVWLSYMAGEILLREFLIFRIPLIFFAGGFLGGIAWCMHNGINWLGMRLFDARYVIWYVAHPLVSAILGGIVAFLILSGLVTLTGQTDVVAGTTSNFSLTLFATIMLLAFGAGFSARYIWQKLDSLVRKALGIDKASDVRHDEVMQDVMARSQEST